MKKTIAMLLVAMLTVDMVFADASLTGKFTSKLAYDLDENTLAFSEPDDKTEITFEWTGGSENEGDIYAIIKGELKINLDSTKAYDVVTDDSSFKLPEASINGENWKLSLMSAAEMPKYATGWETYDDGDDNVDLSAPVDFKDDVGLTLTINNLLKAGVAMNIDFDKNGEKNVLGWVSTNDLAFGDVTVNTAACMKKKAGDALVYGSVGAGVKYANDTISATVGTDTVFGIPTKDGLKSTFDMDVAATFTYADLVAVDAYYATNTALGGSDHLDTYGIDFTVDEDKKEITLNGLGRGFAGADPEDYVSAKVAFDMNSFDVPVAVTIAALDIIDNPYVDVEGAFTLDAFDITAFAGFQYMDNATTIHVGGEVGYDIENVGKLAAGATYLCMIPDAKGADAQNLLGLDVSITNTTLISGATLKGGYKTPNIIGDSADAGEIYVQVKMTF